MRVSGINVNDGVGPASLAFRDAAVQPSREGWHMYNPWFAAAMLAMESIGVVYLRSLKLACGGPEAEDERRRMVSEKVAANAAATSILMAGGSLQSVIEGYRMVVDANASRLSTPAVVIED